MHTRSFATIRLITIFAIFSITPTIQFNKNFAVIAVAIAKRIITSPSAISRIWSARQGAAEVAVCLSRMARYGFGPSTWLMSDCEKSSSTSLPTV
jgi:hypothetical protein